MNIYEAITGIMSEGYTIAKEKRNAKQGFLYRGIDDVMNTFQPLMAKYKIFVVPKVLECTRQERASKEGNVLLYSILKMEYTFYAEDGSNISAVVIGEGMDSGDKASNKAMAVAMKYAMFQVFCIPTEEMPDPDPDTPPNTYQIAKCQACGKEITEVKLKDGNIWTVNDVVNYSQNKFNKILCPECQRLERKGDNK